MQYEFASVVVTAVVATNIRSLSQHLDRLNTDGMFIVGLSPTGVAPATHFISTGMVPSPYVNAITNNVRLFNIAKAAYEADGETFPYTQAQVNNALSQCTYSNGTFAGASEDPFALMARLGLKMIQPAVA